MQAHKEVFCGYCHLDSTGHEVNRVEAPWHLKDGSFGMDTHFLLRCARCDCIFYMIERTNSEDEDFDVGEDGRMYRFAYVDRRFYPPKPKRAQPTWFPRLMLADSGLYLIMSEIYRAFEHGLSVLCVSGIRTAIDRLFDFLKIDSRLRFDEKFKEFQVFISPAFAQMVSTLIDAGSAAIHRGWQCSEEQISEMLEHLESVVFYLCFQPDPKSVEMLKSQIPQRVPRKKES